MALTYSMNSRYGWIHHTWTTLGELVVDAFPALLRNSRGVPVAFVAARDTPKKELAARNRVFLVCLSMERAFCMCAMLSRPLQW